MSQNTPNPVCSGCPGGCGFSGRCGGCCIRFGCCGGCGKRGSVICCGCVAVIDVVDAAMGVADGGLSSAVGVWLCSMLWMLWWVWQAGVCHVLWVCGCVWCCRWCGGCGRRGVCHLLWVCGCVWCCGGCGRRGSVICCGFVAVFDVVDAVVGVAGGGLSSAVAVVVGVAGGGLSSAVYVWLCLMLWMMWQAGVCHLLWVCGCVWCCGGCGRRGSVICCGCVWCCGGCGRRGSVICCGCVWCGCGRRESVICCGCVALFDAVVGVAGGGLSSVVAVFDVVDAVVGVAGGGLSSAVGVWLWLMLWWVWQAGVCHLLWVCGCVWCCGGCCRRGSVIWCGCVAVFDVVDAVVGVAGGGLSSVVAVCDVVDAVVGVAGGGMSSAVDVWLWLMLWMLWWVWQAGVCHLLWVCGCVDEIISRPYEIARALMSYGLVKLEVLHMIVMIVLSNERLTKSSAWSNNSPYAMWMSESSVWDSHSCYVIRKR